MELKTGNQKRLFLLLLLLSATCRVVYPAETLQKHFNLGAGYVWHGIRDNGLSPLYYSGNQYFFNAGYMQNTAELSQSLQVTTFFGNAYPGIYPDLTSSKMSQVKAQINYDWLKSVNKTVYEPCRIFIGGSWRSQFAHYEHNLFSNSSINNYFISTAQLSAALFFPVNKADNQFLISLQANVPFLAVIIRPSYSYIKPEGFLDHSHGNLESIIRSIEVSSFGKFQGVGSDLVIKYDTGTNYSFQIGYSWEYWNHQTENRLETAGHSIVIKVLFNL